MADIFDLNGHKVRTTLPKGDDEPDYLQYVIEDKDGRKHEVIGFLGLTPTFVAVAQQGSVVFALPMENFKLAYIVDQTVSDGEDTLQ